MVPQLRETIAFSIELAGCGPSLFGVQEVAVFGHHQEDKPIDKAEEFVEPLREIDLSGFQFGRKVRVGLKEAGAQNL